MTRKPRKPITKNVMQGIDEWNDGFGKEFRRFIEKVQQGAFNRGVAANIGRFTEKPVPLREYQGTKHLKRALLHAINGACKSFENDHSIKIPKKGSLTKRIAGQVEKVFERYELFIIDNHNKEKD